MIKFDDKVDPMEIRNIKNKYPIQWLQKEFTGVVHTLSRILTT